MFLFYKWAVHYDRKVKLLKLVRQNTIDRLRRNGMRYEEIIASLNSSLDTSPCSLLTPFFFPAILRANIPMLNPVSNHIHQFQQEMIFSQ